MGVSDAIFVTCDQCLESDTFESTWDARQSGHWVEDDDGNWFCCDACLEEYHEDDEPDRSWVDRDE